ncbi:hypothetical protein CEV32_2088 [Brucella rhizosphaerae]|uniref:Uncharacterized protein n=1 Tax=Brucella rhizosphaerae TaxID=571254 RepID=A0A256F475_9HYPH|nr:hypothetical protein CEV32_2088 [Brucella rhizosphaerae]
MEAEGRVKPGLFRFLEAAKSALTELELLRDFFMFSHTK